MATFRAAVGRGPQVVTTGGTNTSGPTAPNEPPAPECGGHRQKRERGEPVRYHVSVRDCPDVFVSFADPRRRPHAPGVPPNAGPVVEPEFRRSPLVVDAALDVEVFGAMIERNRPGTDDGAGGIEDRIDPSNDDPLEIA